MATSFGSATPRMVMGQEQGEVGVCVPATLYTSLSMPSGCGCSRGRASGRGRTLAGGCGCGSARVFVYKF